MIAFYGLTPKESGKNNKFFYYCKTYLNLLTPRALLKRRYERLMEVYKRRADKDFIDERVSYYFQNGDIAEKANLFSLKELSKTESVYHRDFYEYSRFFNENLSVSVLFRDNRKMFDYPTVLKSRMIADGANGDVLLNMDKVRHFTFLTDKINFLDKKPSAIYRGASYQSNRLRFMKMYFGSELVDCGDTSNKKTNVPEEWRASKISLYDHLKWRYILSLEGNDVASNLKWIMSSNSIAVMPKPTCETWFMEGKLIGGYHYIEIKEDFSDLEEKIAYYNEHVDEAEAIIQHAHEYIEGFLDQEREDIISLLVLKKYFERTNPNVPLFAWN